MEWCHHSRKMAERRMTCGSDREASADNVNGRELEIRREERSDFDMEINMDNLHAVNHLRVLLGEVRRRRGIAEKKDERPTSGTLRKQRSTRWDRQRTIHWHGKDSPAMSTPKTQCYARHFHMARGTLRGIRHHDPYLTRVRWSSVQMLP
jgi:hypothetical protein